MKKGYITNLRVLAILLVVVGHSIILYSPDWGLYSTTRSVPMLAEMKKIINFIQMPLFYSVAGYLFVHTLKRKKAITIIKDKLLRIIYN